LVFVCFKSNLVTVPGCKAKLLFSILYRDSVRSSFKSNSIFCYRNAGYTSHAAILHIIFNSSSSELLFTQQQSNSGVNGLSTRTNSK